MTEETNPGKSVTWNGNVTDLVSINTFVPVEIDHESFKIQLTTRHGATPEKIVNDFKNHVAALAEIRKLFPVSTPYELPADNGEPQYVPVEEPQHTDTGTFPAGKLIAEVNNGKVGYKVTAKDGERFPKYPVRVWPEVLDGAGIKYDLINPVKPETSVNLTGWTAEYTKNEKGYPAKVVRLTK